MEQIFEDLYSTGLSDSKNSSATSEIRTVVKTGFILSLRQDTMSPSQIGNTLIIKNKDICGGKAIIQGTRIAVSNIIALAHVLRWDISEILDEYPHLTRGQITAAENYYLSNRDEIDDVLESEQSIDR